MTASLTGIAIYLKTISIDFNNHEDIIMNDKYLSTRDLSNRFRCSNRTIFRRMKRDKNPLPSPVIKQVGATNLWCVSQVDEWENREIERTQALDSR